LLKVIESRFILIYHFVGVMEVCHRTYGASQFTPTQCVEIIISK
jgi:hypothetical protein